MSTAEVDASTVTDGFAASEPRTKIASMESLTDLLRRRAVEAPASIAVVSGDDQATYSDLDRASDAAARRLLRAGVRPGELVGLLADRDMDTIVLLLAILKCGAAYVPLDPGYPRRRLNFIAEDAQMTHIVGARRTAIAVGLHDHRFTDCDADAAADDPTCVDRFDRPAGDSAAYVIYTSGSTGTPKGCVVTHRNVLAMLDGALNLFDFSPHDRWAVVHSFCFDFSVWELWGALSTGATAVLAPWKTILAPGTFVSFLKENRITILNQVPSVFRYLAQEWMATDDRPADVRYLIFGGEKVSMDVVDAFVARLGPAAPSMINMYGITENTVHSTFKRLDAGTLAGAAASPIGGGLPHVGVHVLDARQRPTGRGTVGELWLSGPSVITGYLNREDLTRERFRKLPVGGGGQPTRCYHTGDLVRVLPDGELDYVGRVDQQVKVRGYRIELQEVETILQMNPLVREAAVVAVETHLGTTLAAMIVAAEPVATDVVARVADDLRQTAPAYMVPGLYRVVDQLPLTLSGKRDSAAIIAEFASDAPSATSPSPLPRLQQP
ncbi:amino acid adenylation domain-containing protein [Amycolatopsis sp. NBC_00348]|uniref:amino acid adenylation domain-containing protein n=1 Tax=Amycolatopsis sp. NBC_00348 TaxID=2975956 RepID=UPI002E25F205